MNSAPATQGSAPSAPNAPFVVSAIANPLLNALFNSKNFHADSALRATVSTIAKNPADYIVLVPETSFLLERADRDSQKPYSELCTRADFLQSHIVRINRSAEDALAATGSESLVPYVYSTLNGKHVFLQKGVLRNYKGFKHDFTLRISRHRFFKAFAGYLPFGANYHLAYIDEAMEGNPTDPTTCDTSPPLPHRRDSQLPPPPMPSFDTLLTEFPNLAARLGDLFKKLFAAFSVKDTQSLDRLSESFNSVMSQGSQILNTTLPDSLCAEILRKYPQLDLNQVVFNYIELNIYDRFWAKYVQLSAEEEGEKDTNIDAAYESLKYLSANQIGLPQKWLQNPARMIGLHKKVLKAVAEFQKLQFSQTSQEQCHILNRTMEYLSEKETEKDGVIDADTLISLLILVVAHAAVKHLNCHFRYIREYSFMEEESLQTGFTGYTLSSFEAVVSYYDDPANLERLTKCSLENGGLWRAIKNADCAGISALLDPYSSGDVPLDSFIRARTLNAESCLMQAAQTPENDTLQTLLDYVSIFTVDDLLEDHNVEGMSLLTVALQQKHPLCEEIADSVLQGSAAEITDYCDSLDCCGRNLGHLLFHNYRLIPLFGAYLDWTQRDSTGKTPFMTLIRCYDHPEYRQMVSLAMDAMGRWYASKGLEFDFREHIDKKGSSVIHAIRDEAVLKEVLAKFSCIDVNWLNHSHQSALVQYVRYNRVGNVKEIVKDSRLDVLSADDRYHMCAEDYVKLDQIESADDNGAASMAIMETLDATVRAVAYAQKVAVVRVKYDKNHDPCLYLSCDNGSVVVHRYSDFVKCLKLLKMQFPYTYFLGVRSDSWFASFTDTAQLGNFDHGRKFRLNRLLENCNVLVKAVQCNASLRESELFRSFFTRQEALNEMDWVKKAGAERQSRLNEVARRHTVLHPEDAANYKLFLKYSNSQLGQLLKAAERLYRLGCFCEQKWLDIQEVQRLLHLDEGAPRLGIVRDDGGMEVFLDTLRVLRESVAEMSAGIDRFVAKVNDWWKLYGEIKALGDELVKIRNTRPEGRQTQINAVLLDIAGLLGTLDEKSIKGMREKLVDNHPEIPQDGGASATNYLTEFIGKGRKDNLNKHFETFSRLQQQMVGLNVTLRKEYEELCIELSNLYEFREQMLRDSLRRLAVGQVRKLRIERQLTLRSLERFKRT